MKSMAPEWSPYRFALINLMRYKDSDGNWEDGHLWTGCNEEHITASTARILAPLGKV
jgi:hypothetical protein